MGNLIDAGEAKGLEDAYAKAKRLDDELYKESLDAQRKVPAEEDARRRQQLKRLKLDPEQLLHHLQFCYYRFRCLVDGIN